MVEINQSLMKMKNKVEKNLLIESLSQANTQLHNSGEVTIIEAVKNVSALSEYRRFNVDDSVVSVNPSDYQFEG